MRSRIVVTVNSTGRQTASFVRVASAVGWQVRAQMRDRNGLVAVELESLPNVTLFVGDLEDRNLINELFQGAEIAFINTTHWGDEVAIGKSLADAAKRVGIQHYIYSSLPDHSVFNPDWKGLPMWKTKYKVEQYVRSIGLPATFIYTAIYHNNFTSLRYPLFEMQLQEDGSFEWEAPFDPDTKLPWLDAEHDVGPAVLQIFIEGPQKWVDQTIPLAFSLLTPKEVCAAFSLALQRPVEYVHGPIRFEVPVPKGYRKHLEVLEETLIKKKAPYFGPAVPESTKQALELWEGFRSMEEYAREVFPVEEMNNGLTWMNDDEPDTPSRELDREPLVLV